MFVKIRLRLNPVKGTGKSERNYVLNFVHFIIIYRVNKWDMFHGITYNEQVSHFIVHVNGCGKFFH